MASMAQKAVALLAVGELAQRLGHHSEALTACAEAAEVADGDMGMGKDKGRGMLGGGEGGRGGSLEGEGRGGEQGGEESA